MSKSENYKPYNHLQQLTLSLLYRRLFQHHTGKINCSLQNKTMMEKQRTVHIELKIGESWVKTEPIFSTPQMSATTLADRTVMQLHKGGIKARVVVITQSFNRF